MDSLNDRITLSHLSKPMHGVSTIHSCAILAKQTEPQHWQCRFIKGTWMTPSTHTKQARVHRCCQQFSRNPNKLFFHPLPAAVVYSIHQTFSTCSRVNVPHHNLKRNVSSLNQPDYCSLSACLITGGGGGRAQGLNKWIQLWRIILADTGIITFRILLPNASQQ